jgi:hypothetical protein
MMGYKTIRFERNLLYDQVWEKPMIVLALEYGLSDVGLRKICRRLNIPLPPQGYHLRKYKGQKSPLPPAKNGILEYEAHLYQPDQSEADVSSVAILIPEISFEEQPENRIIVPDQLNSPHPLIAEAKRQLKKAKPDSYGRLSAYRNSGCDISVFPGSVDRSLRIMNALLKAMAKRKYLVPADKLNHSPVVKVLDEPINFRLAERAHQVRHVPTAEELLKKKRGLYFHDPAFDYLATGELALSITDVYHYNNEKVCLDNKRGKIEGKLNAFIISLIKRALQMKDERARRQQEEKIRRERERQQWERESQIRKEQERVDILMKQCNAWHESQNLRAFINATKEKYSPIDPEGELAKWLIWASRQVDRLDPLNSQSRFQIP